MLKDALAQTVGEPQAFPGGGIPWRRRRYSRRVQKDGRTSGTEDPPVIAALERLRRKRTLTSRPASATKVPKASHGAEKPDTLSPQHIDQMAARMFKSCLGQP